MNEKRRDERGHSFLPPREELAEIPGLFHQEETPPNAVTIHMHYFAAWAGAHWWIAEIGRSKDSPNHWDAFGFRSLSCDAAPEWGRFNLNDLEWLRLRVPPHPAVPLLHLHHLAGVSFLIQRDLSWRPAPAFQCIPGVTRDGHLCGGV